MIQIRCINAQQAHSVLTGVVWPAIKGQLLAGGRPLTVEVREEKRSDAENRLLHALLGHITKAEREHTPPELAAWLVELARRCKVKEPA